MVFEYILGISLALFSTCIFNIVPVMQKEVLDQIKEEKLGDQIKLMFSNKKWLIGLFLGVAGGLPYFIALQVAGIMVVQPLLNFGFIVLVIAAKKKLNEQYTIKSNIAIILMIFMPLFIVLGDVTQPILFTTPKWLYLFIGIVCIISVLSILVAKKIPILWSIATGFQFSLGAISIQTISSIIDFTLPFNEILSIALDNFIWIFFSMLFNIIAMILAQIGLQKNEASKFNPIQQTINNTTCIIGGAVIFLQIAQSPFFYYIGFILGAVGIFLLGNYQK